MSLDNVLAVAGVARGAHCDTDFWPCSFSCAYACCSNTDCEYIEQASMDCLSRIAIILFCSRYDDVGRHSRHNNNYVCLKSVVCFILGL